jgi:hypothetical protein
MTFELQINKNSFPFHTIFMGVNRVREGSRSQTISGCKQFRRWCRRPRSGSRR